MTMPPTMRTTVLFLLLCLSQARKRKNGNPLSRSIAIENQSGVPIDIRWIDQSTRELADSNLEEPLVYGGDTGINSYVGHSFEVQEVEVKGKCRYRMCRKAYIKVSENEDQRFIIEKDFSVTIEDNRSRATELASKAVEACKKLPLTELAACLERQVDATISKRQEEIDFQRDLRINLGQQWANYACEDYKTAIRTTESIANGTWSYFDKRSESTYSKRSKHDVSLLFEEGDSSIRLVHDFLTPEQCASLVEAASLSVADKGTNPSMSQHLIPLKNLGMIQSSIDKAEQLMTRYLQAKIQYDGKDPMLLLERHAASASVDGNNECIVDASSGECKDDNSQKRQKQVSLSPNAKDQASLFIFCSTPEAGGMIHFPKVGVSVKPKLGEAMIVFYEEGDDELRDAILCPVQQGELIQVIDRFSYA